MISARSILDPTSDAKLTDDGVGSPVGGSGEGNTLGSETLREDLGGNDPGDGTDGRGETGDEDGRECDQ